MAIPSLHKYASQLIGEGMPVEEVQSMCDLHSSVLQEILVEPERPKVLHGHPIDTFQRENEALRETVAELHRRTQPVVLREVTSLTTTDVLALRETANQLADIDKHYQRKENLLFSCLERHGVTGPSKVMWGKDDEVRRMLKHLDETLKDVEGKQTGDVVSSVHEAVDATARAVEEMIVKEEKILFPMAANTLTEEEWGEIWR